MTQRIFVYLFSRKTFIQGGITGVAFRVTAAHCKKICPERNYWPGWLAGIPKGVPLKEYNRPFFTIIFKPKIVILRVKILVFFRKK